MTPSAPVTISEPVKLSPTKPTIGRVVLVKTHGKPINGQEEHAGLITQVHSDTCISAVYWPPHIGEQLASSIMPEQEGQTMGFSWRWPPIAPALASVVAPLIAPAEPSA